MSDWEGFEIEGRLGVGTTGTVWLARQLSVGRLVALKALAPELTDDQAVREHLRHEAQVLARLDDPHCVAVYGYLESATGAAIVMEYVEGVSLRALAEHGPLSVEQALSVLEGALGGLAAAHGQGIVHGDLKPENILLSTSGVSKLVDFGLAAAVGTRRAPGTGTPTYASPEAAAGERLGVASDLYSAGLVLSELLAGAAPMAADSASAAAAVPAPVASLVRRSLDPDPAVRPTSARAFLEELRAAAEEGCGEDWRRRAVLVPLVAAAATGAASALGAAKAGAASTPSTMGTARRGARGGRALHAHPWVAAATAAVVVVAGVAIGVGATRGTGAPSAPAANVTRPAATPAISASDVASFVKGFYEQYLACLSGNAVQSCTDHLVKSNGTAHLDSYYTPPAGYSYQADPITCAQNTGFDITVSDVTTTQNTASGMVNEAFSTSSATIKFVVVRQSGTLKIDSTTCDPPVAPRPLPTGGTVSGGTNGSSASLAGTYTISLPPSDQGCGTPSLNGETLTVSGTTATITPVGGGTALTGTATVTGSTFSVHVTNGITNAPGAIVVDLTGSAQPGGSLSGQSQNGGVYPGGGQGFGCNFPFTAARTSGTSGSTPAGNSGAAPAGNSGAAPAPSAAAAAPCTAAAITAAAQAVAKSSFYSLDTFQCSGNFAAAGVDVDAGGGNIDAVTMLFMAQGGTWQPADRGVDCADDSVPAAIYQLACNTN